jgi:poly [ADP-ribose] polymerase
VFKDATVYVDNNGVVFDASLNQTNIGDNNNKFYFLQLLEDKKGKQCFTHTCWGRVGEPGKSKTMGPESFEDALEDFEKKFKEKSGLDWDNRYEQPTSKSKKYTFVEKSYESEDDNGAAAADDDDDDDDDDKANVKSNLPIATQRLMELIFDENHFNSVLEEIGYNSDKLPLGKLGQNSLKTGFEHLKELASLIKHPSLAQNKYSKSQKEMIEDFSNKYYSTIPHVFARSRAPMIDNNDLLRKEVVMLDTLTDMEVANTIMNANSKSKDSRSVSLLDKRFQDLKLKEMTPLDHKSKEYKELSKYLIESSSTGHNLKYRLEDIFRIERPGEVDRLKRSKFAKLKDKNRLLLWHGSRTPNYSGILSQGLRIAPPEVSPILKSPSLPCTDSCFPGATKWIRIWEGRLSSRHIQQKRELLHVQHVGRCRLTAAL